MWARLFFKMSEEFIVKSIWEFLIVRTPLKGGEYILITSPGGEEKLKN